MDKIKAYHSFWNSFNFKAYTEANVPDADERKREAGAAYPYITYESAEDDFGQSLMLVASIWDRSTAWTTAVNKLKDIEAEIGRGGKMVPYDGGAFWIRKGSPWAQRMGDEADSSVKRIVMNLIVEFID